MRQNYMQQGRLGQGNQRFQNAQDSLYDNVQGALRAKTHLVQLYCSDPEEAPQLISSPHKDGVPIMVIIQDPGSLVCKLNVPNGMFTLEKVWGVENGIKEPGCDPCYCSYKEIAVMITKNTIRFRCPITQIPTKDNVRVTMDIGINFHIGRSEETQNEDTKKFFYNFGPNRLEELLSEEVDEQIRSFVKEIKVQRVRDVKTELTTSIRDQLQAKFDPYGVVIESVTVMNVILPRDLREFLMHTTNYDVYLQKQVKQQKNRMLILNNNENKSMLQQQRDNIQKLMTAQHDIDVEEINLIQTTIESESSQVVKEILAKKRQTTKLIDAENIKALAEIRANADSVKIMEKAKAHSEAQHISADNESYIIKEEAAARLEVSKAKSAALIKESTAESAQSNNMEGMRRHSEKMALVGGMRQMAGRQKIVVAGNNGQKVLEFYNSTVDLVNQR